VLEEIVVTAQKRAESIQNVPISINALGGDDLHDRGIADAGDIVKAFPSLSTKQNGAINNGLTRGVLRLVNGLIPVDRGEVHVGPHAVHRLKTDREMIALRKYVSIVFQQYNLFPHKTAIQNIMMAPVDVLGQPRPGRGPR
jgi:ABC-type histidine transport system ATPase subunit